MLASIDLRPNEARSLEALFRAGALSRAALARQLGLTRSTTGALVQTLIEAGLARERPDAPDETEDGETRVGRPGILVAPDDPPALADALAALADDPEARWSWARMGREHALEHDWSWAWSNLRRVLEEL